MLFVISFTYTLGWYVFLKSSHGFDFVSKWFATNCEHEWWMTHVQRTLRRNERDREKMKTATYSLAGGCTHTYTCDLRWTWNHVKLFWPFTCVHIVTMSPRIHSFIHSFACFCRQQINNRLRNAQLNSHRIHFRWRAMQCISRTWDILVQLCVSHFAWILIKRRSELSVSI